MSETDLQTPSRLVIRRTLSASRERLFAAWTQPELMRAWLGPAGVTAVEVESDARSGGAYRIVMQQPSGERMAVRGVYRDVVPPERLSYTWTWEEDTPAEETETLVTVEFFERGTHTELVLTHERFASSDSRDRHDNGWSIVLAQLASFLAA